MRYLSRILICVLALILIVPSPAQAEPSPTPSPAQAEPSPAAQAEPSPTPGEPSPTPESTPGEPSPTSGEPSPASDWALTAGWLARSLGSTNDLALAPTGEIDYASTAYATLALRGLGVANDQVIASATALYTSKEDFISTPDQIGQKTTAISLMILTTWIAGLDPSQYQTDTGTRDLYADLRSAVHEDGSISDMPSAYGQAFAILALATSYTEDPKSAVSWLLAQPCTDSASPGYGGYGFAGPGSCDDVDPDSTALAVIALRAAGVESSTLTPSGTYLTSIQDPSGGFVSPWSGANANTTGLAVAALNSLGGFEDQATKGKDFLVSLIYGCESANSTTAPAIGAMAFDATSRQAELTVPLDAESQARYFQASAQGIFGLISISSTMELDLPEPGTGVADSSVCDLTSSTPPSETQAPSGDSTPAPSQSTTTIPSALWWILGSVVVVALALVAWRFLATRRK